MITIAQLAKTMRKILLVDDDAELRRLLATYLGRHGFDTLLLPDTRQLEILQIVLELKSVHSISSTNSPNGLPKHLRNAHRSKRRNASLAAQRF